MSSSSAQTSTTRPSCAFAPEALENAAPVVQTVTESSKGIRATLTLPANVCAKIDNKRCIRFCVGCNDLVASNGVFTFSVIMNNVSATPRYPYVVTFEGTGAQGTLRKGDSIVFSGFIDADSNVVWKPNWSMQCAQVCDKPQRVVVFDVVASSFRRLAFPGAARLCTLEFSGAILCNLAENALKDVACQALCEIGKEGKTSTAEMKL